MCSFLNNLFPLVQDLDPRILDKVQPRGPVRGRGGIMRGVPMARGFPRGMSVGGGIVVRGNLRGGRIMTGGPRPGTQIFIYFFLN